jgi:hypothetical protein
MNEHQNEWETVNSISSTRHYKLQYAYLVRTRHGTSSGFVLKAYSRNLVRNRYGKHIYVHSMPHL